MPDLRVTELPPIDAVVGSDLLMVIDDPAGVPANKKATVSQLLAISPPSGDVWGPASAVDGSLAMFDGATGKYLKDTLILASNVAQLNKRNIFTAPIYIQDPNPVLPAPYLYPALMLHDTREPVDQRKWRIAMSGGILYFQPMNDAENLLSPSGGYVNLTRAGLFTITGTGMTTTGRVAATGLDINVPSGAASNEQYLSAYSHIRVHLKEMNSNLTFTIMNHQSELHFSAPNDAAGLNWTTLDAMALDRSGNLKTYGYLYPGRIHGPAGQQAIYYLASSDSYGLHSNTGLHLGGSLWTDANLSAAGSVNAAGGTLSGKLDITGGSDGVYYAAPIEIRMPANPRVAFHWPGVVAAQLGMDSAGNIRTYDNPGTGFAPLLCSNFAAYGTIYAQSYIYCVGAMYPGRVDTGAAQTSYYLASHGSYGLWSNTGLYLSGGFYPIGGMSSGYLLGEWGPADFTLEASGWTVNTQYAAIAMKHNGFLHVTWMVEATFSGAGAYGFRIPGGFSAQRYAQGVPHCPGAGLTARLEVAPGDVWIYIYSTGGINGASRYGGQIAIYVG